MAQICVPDKDDEGGRRLDIHIIDDDRVFELRAANEADRNRWMQLLSANRKSYRRSVKVGVDSRVHSIPSPSPPTPTPSSPVHVEWMVW